MQSFEATRKEAGSRQQKTPLDFIAAEYWQDYVAGRPIDGGVSFEKELRSCRLDGSVDSLKQLDVFLEMLQYRNTLRPDFFMNDALNRNLMLFVGFYIGKVLAEAWGSEGAWLSQQQLLAQYPHLNIHPNNPFHFMAIDYRPQSNDTPDNTLFFVLEPIALKVFGSRLKMPAVIGTQITPSVYEAVVERLPDAPFKKTNHLNNTVDIPIAAAPESLVSPPANENDLTAVQDTRSSVGIDGHELVPLTLTEDSFSEPDSLGMHDTQTDDAYSEQVGNDTLSEPDFALQDEAFASINPSAEREVFDDEAGDAFDTTTVLIDSVDSDSTTNDIANELGSSSDLPQELNSGVVEESIENRSYSATNTSEPQLSEQGFKDLLSELETIPVEQKGDLAELDAVYQQVACVLSQSALPQDKNLDADFSSSNEDAQQQAMQALKSLAADGHTTAMLRLAVFYFINDNEPNLNNIAKFGEMNVDLEPPGVSKLNDQGEMTNATAADSKKSKGFLLVERAAHAGDIRAQRELSRLYFRGLGCTRNAEMGKHWLAEAASNGHEEAKALQETWNKAALLMDAQKQDEKSNKLYLWVIIGVVVVGMVLAFLL